MKHIPRKRFGQNFLTDGGIIDSIVQAIHPQPKPFGSLKCVAFQWPQTAANLRSHAADGKPQTACFV